MGSTVRSMSREAMSLACISIISRFLVHGSCTATRRQDFHQRAKCRDDLSRAHQMGVQRATIPCMRPRAMAMCGPLTHQGGRKCES